LALASVGFITRIPKTQIRRQKLFAESSMSVESTALPLKRSGDYRAIISGGLIAGTMDIIAACIFSMPAMSSAQLPEACPPDTAL